MSSHGRAARERAIAGLTPANMHRRLAWRRGRTWWVVSRRATFAVHAPDEFSAMLEADRCLGTAGYHGPFTLEEH